MQQEETNSIKDEILKFYNCALEIDLGKKKSFETLAHNILTELRALFH